jgi:hypothetical protein
MDMDVFVIPLGGRYELYCEVPEEDLDGDGVPDPPRGFFKGLSYKFRMTLRRVEQERRAGREAAEAGEPRSWTRRLRDRTLCWVAERIAEQRLLWHLRGQESARAVYPADLGDAEAMAIVRRILKRDAERHRLWLVLDSIVFVLSGLLVVVPGPNIVAYYFAFRVVGHYLSMRGARQGLTTVTWTLDPSAELTELRRVVTLPPDARQERLRDVSSRLRLEHLTAFVERVAIPSA